MNRDDLIKHLEKRYTSKRGMLSRIPLSIQPDPLWQDLSHDHQQRWWFDYAPPGRCCVPA